MSDVNLTSDLFALLRSVTEKNADFAVGHDWSNQKAKFSAQWTKRAESNHAF